MPSLLRDIFSSLYLHIPYCRRKCIYCDFYSAGSRQARWEDLRMSLIRELRQRRDELAFPVISIYFGGGTPSLMPAASFVKLMEDLKYAIGEHCINEDAEITIEVNPDDVSPEMIAAWKQAGINRVSIGLQSFSDHTLGRIGRLHDGKTSHKALKMLTDNFENVSGDLIFGLPGQSLDGVKKDLENLLEYPVKHVSVYSLMYEERTALTALRDAGRIEEVTDIDSAAMYGMISGMLAEAGFCHYEISNYAVPGYESVHNSGYWSGRQYLGLGPSAHSYDGDRIRRSNPADIRRYLNHFSSSPDESNLKKTTDAGSSLEPFLDCHSKGSIFNNGELESTGGGFDKNYYEEEVLSDEEQREERVMLSLRTKTGLDLRRFSEDFGHEPLNILIPKAEKWISDGKLKLKGDFLTLTDEGLMISDSIMADLI